MRKFQAALCGLLILCGTAFSQSEKPVKVTGADAQSNSQVSMQTEAGGTNVIPLTGNYVFNGTTWDRMPGTTSGVKTVGSVTPGTASANSLGGTPMICDSATSGTVTAGQAQMVRCSTAGVPATVAIGAFNADGAANGNVGGFVSPGGGAFITSVITGTYNSSTYDRLRGSYLGTMATSQTLTARNSIGTPMVEKGSRWSVISNPAAGSQATASLASEASVRHVADCVSFSAASTTAPVLTALTVNLRDGATGAGTVIWTQQVVISAATGQNVAPFSVCGLNLVGTTATAMTLEFSASLANLIESATITGFNVN